MSRQKQKKHIMAILIENPLLFSIIKKNPSNDFWSEMKIIFISSLMYPN